MGLEYTMGSILSLETVRETRVTIKLHLAVLPGGGAVTSTRG